MNFIRCLFFLAVLSFSSFLLGRALPKHWFRYDSFLFKAVPAERGGALYHKIAIRRWKNKLPDMSVFFYRWMPSKELSKHLSAQQVKVMIEETCVAEFIHVLLGVLGFFCVAIWQCWCGWLVSFLFFLGNLPFCLVQRYNRPKLVKLLRWLESKEPGQDPVEQVGLAIQYE
ncbi:MAG: glycosyl-4,4'-diaponeurosporenoate acyltransferase [Ruminococcaceae bacterium]|nr:glycosyl-4,4'-diaponeurosporenoate acyltransferase [Oscillospiraceae bacterium]